MVVGQERLKGRLAFYKMEVDPPHFPWIQVQVRRDLETSLIRHTRSAADVPCGTSYSCLSIISTSMPSILKEFHGELRSCARSGDGKK